MKRIISSLIAVALLAAIAVATLTACGLFKSITFDEAKENLENAGYEVTVMSGEEFVDWEENPYPFIMAHELENYLHAVKDDDEIYLYFFASVDQASDNYEFMTDKKLSGGQNNKVVYFATKQAKKDAGV